MSNSLWTKPTDALNSNVIGIITLHVSGSLSAHHQEFLAIHRLWYILCSCDETFATRSRMECIGISASYLNELLVFKKYQLLLYLNTHPLFIIGSHSHVISVTSHTLSFHCSGINTCEIFQWSRMTSLPNNWRGLFFNKICNFVPKEGPNLYSNCYKY
jgi:hypothetical protein